MRGWPILAASLLAAACGPYPRDIDGTYDRIERSGVVRVGLTQIGADDRARAEAFVARIAQATGAQPTIDTGPAESQLARLERGDLDLVIGEFAKDTPWATDVAILEPLARHRVGERVVGLAPVAANGENRWVGLLEREIRDQVAAGDGA